MRRGVRTRRRTDAYPLAVLGHHTRPRLTIGAKTREQSLHTRRHALRITTQMHVPVPTRRRRPPLRTPKNEIHPRLARRHPDTVDTTAIAQQPTSRRLTGRMRIPRPAVSLLHRRVLHLVC